MCARVKNANVASCTGCVSYVRKQYDQMEFRTSENATVRISLCFTDDFFFYDNLTFYKRAGVPTKKEKVY